MSAGALIESAGWGLFAVGASLESIASKLNGLVLAVAGALLIVGRVLVQVTPSVVQVYHDLKRARREERALDAEQETRLAEVAASGVVQAQACEICRLKRELESSGGKAAAPAQDDEPTVLKIRPEREGDGG